MRNVDKARAIEAEITLYRIKILRLERQLEDLQCQPDSAGESTLSDADKSYTYNGKVITFPTKNKLSVTV